MENFETIKSEIVNNTLRKIYRSKKPFLEFPYEGLGVLLTYRYIMELGNGKKYAFDRDYIWEWDDSEKIVELKTDSKKEFENKRILDIIDAGDYYFLIDPNMVLHHDQNFGSELIFDKYTVYFNSNGELI